MAEKNLDILISSMSPHIHEGEYVFITLTPDEYEAINIRPLCLFREAEGISLILEKDEADKASLNYLGTWSFITCKVNSSLEAVGFLAAISNALAKAGIALNPVSAFFHDHLFVPKSKEAEAMTILKQLSGNRDV